jgi:hypothetical protein
MAADPRAAPATEQRLALEWELWVVDQLVDGADARDVIAALVEDGLAPALASAKVGEILASPSFRRLHRRAARAAMADQLVRARGTIAPVLEIDRRATIDRGEFYRSYWQRSRPLLLTSAAADMRAVQRWSFEGLAAAHGDLEVEVNVRRGEARRGSDTESRSERQRFGDYLRGAATVAGNDRYIVSRNGLLDRPELAALWDDLTPLPGFLVPPSPPRGASLWIGPAGTRSPIHFDPHGVLLVQVQGRKRVRLVAPDRLAMFEALDGYYASLDVDAPGALTDGAVLTAEIGPGQALFIPLAWFHEVTALEPSITLSLLCFAWPNDFHWLQPVSAPR